MEPEFAAQESGGSDFAGIARLSTLQANVAPAAKLRSQLAAVIETDTAGGGGGGVLSPLAAASADMAQLPSDTFFLPASCLAEHVRGRLVCEHVMRRLEERGVINWAVDQARLPEPDRLFPLTTASDGNCLLHASLLGAWGLHDHGTVGGLSSLRAAMCRYFDGGGLAAGSGLLQQRFLAEATRENAAVGFAWDTQQADAEWARLTAEARTQGAFLRPVHVLALACALRRPIVLYADSAAAREFGGLYLPLLCEPSACVKQPLALVYDASHFMPLVAVAADAGAVDSRGGGVEPAARPVLLPLCCQGYSPLRVRFQLAEEEAGGSAAMQERLEQYMATESLPGPKEPALPCCAMQRHGGNNPVVAQMLRNLVDAADRQHRAEQSAAGTLGRDGGGGAAAPPVLPKLQQLLEMGYGWAVAVEALRRAGDDVAEAVGLLVAGFTMAGDEPARSRVQQRTTADFAGPTPRPGTCSTPDVFNTGLKAIPLAEIAALQAGEPGDRNDETECLHGMRGIMADLGSAVGGMTELQLERLNRLRAQLLLAQTTLGEGSLAYKDLQTRIGAELRSPGAELDDEQMQQLMHIMSGGGGGNSAAGSGSAAAGAFEEQFDDIQFAHAGAKLKGKMVLSPRTLSFASERGGKVEFPLQVIGQTVKAAGGGIGTGLMSQFTAQLKIAPVERPYDEASDCVAGARHAMPVPVDAPAVQHLFPTKCRLVSERNIAMLPAWAAAHNNTRVWDQPAESGPVHRSARALWLRAGAPGPSRRHRGGGGGRHRDAAAERERRAEQGAADEGRRVLGADAGTARSECGAAGWRIRRRRW